MFLTIFTIKAEELRTCCAFYKREREGYEPVEFKAEGTAFCLVFATRRGVIVSSGTQPKPTKESSFKTNKLEEALELVSDRNLRKLGMLFAKNTIFVLQDEDNC